MKKMRQCVPSFLLYVLSHGSFPPYPSCYPIMVVGTRPDVTMKIQGVSLNSCYPTSGTETGI